LVKQRLNFTTNEQNYQLNVHKTRYTASKDQKTVYAIVLFWPEFDQVDLGAPSAGPKTKVSFLGYDGNIDVSAFHYSDKFQFI